MLAVRQRALGARVRAQIAQAALQAEDLAKPFDVAPRERQLAELQARRPFRDFAVRLRHVLAGVSGMPSGTISVPSRIGFVSVSGVDSNRRR